jgi:hypothetical protein
MNNSTAFLVFTIVGLVAFAGLLWTIIPKHWFKSEVITKYHTIKSMSIDEVTELLCDISNLSPANKLSHDEYQEFYVAVRKYLEEKADIESD